MAAQFFALLACGCLLTLALVDPESSRRFLRLGAILSFAFTVLAVGLCWGRHPIITLLVPVAIALGCLLVELREGKVAWMRLLALAGWLSLLSLSVLLAPQRPGLVLALNQALSGLVLGSALLAMLLGHSYLTEHGMTIAPLKRLAGVFAVALGLRIIFSLAVGGWLARSVDPHELYRQTLMLSVRGLVGLLLPAVLAYMIVQTVKIRATQSATGILYLVVVLVFIGELTGQYLLENLGVPF